MPPTQPHKAGAIHSRVPTQVRSLLSRRGWSQADLARKVGISDTAISYVMRQSRMSLGLMQRMAQALGHEVVISLRPAVPRNRNGKRKRSSA